MYASFKTFATVYDIESFGFCSTISVLVPGLIGGYSHYALLGLAVVNGIQDKRASEVDASFKTFATVYDIEPIRVLFNLLAADPRISSAVIRRRPVGAYRSYIELTISAHRSSCFVKAFAISYDIEPFGFCSRISVLVRPIISGVNSDNAPLGLTAVHRN